MRRRAGRLPEADLGMFSMFGRTGAHTKKATKGQKKFLIFLQHVNKPEILK